MKKNYYVSVFIFFGLLSLLYALGGDDTDNYAENVFSDEAEKVEKAIDAFFTKHNETSESIQTVISTDSIPKDSVNLTRFFTGILSKDKSLNSIVLVNGDTKIAFKKDGKSIIHAIDTGKVMGAVTWKRYKNGKFISSWQEHFEKKIDISKWYAQLADNKSGMIWKFPDQKDFMGNTFFVGRSFGNRDYIVLGYSVPELMNEFNIDNEQKGKHLILGLTDGSYLDLSGESPIIFKKDRVKDSVLHNILKYGEAYHTSDKSIFNFKYGNEIYWNLLMPTQPNTGIKEFIYAAPESSLPIGINARQNELLKWPGIIMLLIGIGMLFVDPEEFEVKKIKNTPLKELLENDEGRKLEFKSSARWDYRQGKINPALEQVILKTVAAFANTDGGTLLIGVNDDKEVIGLDKDFTSLKKSNADYYEIHLRNLFHRHFGVKNVSKLIRIAFEKSDGKDVCKVIVLKAETPVYTKTKDKNGVEREKFYVRSGNSTQEINSMAEINDYINTHFKK